MKRLLVLALLLGWVSLASGQGASLINGSRVVAGWINACDATGSASNYLCTFTPAITAYVSNQCFVFKANHTNTTAASLNVNNLGAKMIKKYVAGSPQDLAANEIGTGQQVHVCYDGTNMQIQSVAGTGGGGGGTGDITAVGTNCTTGDCGGTVTPLQGMIWSPIAEPATPSTAQAHGFVRSAEKIWCVKDDAGGVSCTVRNKTQTTNEFLVSLTNGVLASARPTFANLAPGTADPTQLPNPTTTTLGGVKAISCAGIGHIERINNDGSVTCTADGTSGGTFSAVGNCTGGSCGTAFPGTALTSFSWSPIATPATPASGRATQFVSLNKTMAVINDAGVVTHGVQDCALTPNNWIQALNADGSCQKAQIGFGNLAPGQASSAQMPAVMSATKVKPLSKQLSDDNSIDDITVDTCDICYLTTLSQATTFQAPTGTPAEGQYLEIRIASSVARGLTWVTTTNGYSGNAGVTLPTSTTGSNFEDHFTFRWNGTAQRWVLTGSTVLSAPLDSNALLPKLRTKTCMMVLGDDDSAATALTDVKLTQLEQCLASVAQTVKEITVKSVGGAATVQVHRRTGSTNTALHTGSITAGTCTRLTGDATGIDGTTCFTTLTGAAVSIPAGAWIGLTSGVANGARRVSVAVTTWVN